MNDADAGLFAGIEDGADLGSEHSLRQRLLDQLNAGVEPALMHDGIARVAGHEEHLQIGLALLHRVTELPAVHPRQHDVGQQEIDRSSNGQRRRAVLCLENPVPEPTQNLDMPISIFETPTFVSNLRRYLPGKPDFPGLIIELTEDEVISDPELAREIAIQLKLYNIDVAIDDFGRGYATLEQAQKLPFSELKIDRSKVDGCSQAPHLHRECRGIVELAHRLDMIAVAEGVESERDLKALTEMGCDAAQGLALAPPMGREEFTQWVGRL